MVAMWWQCGGSEVTTWWQWQSGGSVVAMRWQIWWQSGGSVVAMRWQGGDAMMAVWWQWCEVSAVGGKVVANVIFATFCRSIVPIPLVSDSREKDKLVASKKLLAFRQTTSKRVEMKTRHEDWDGYQAKPPPLRRKAGITTGRRLAEPVAPGVSRDQLTKWIGRRSHNAAKRAPAGGQAGKSVPLRQTERPCPALTCANEKTYFKVKTNSIEKAKAIVVPSAHDLAKPDSSELSTDLLVTWLGIIAHGKTVHPRADHAATRFEAAARTEEAAIAFSPEFSQKHSRIVKEYKRVAASSGSRWSIADAGAKRSAATPVADKDEFRQFLLKHLRKPRIAGLDWSLGCVEKKKRWMTRFGTPLRAVASAS